MPNPNDQANPVVTQTSRSSNGNFTNAVEGGFSKFEEAFLRLYAGLMPVSFNGKAFGNAKIMATAAREYAEEFLIQAEAREAARQSVLAEDQIKAEARNAASAEAPQAPRSTLILP